MKESSDQIIKITLLGKNTNDNSTLINWISLIKLEENVQINNISQYKFSAMIYDKKYLFKIDIRTDYTLIDYNITEVILFVYKSSMEINLEDEIKNIKRNNKKMILMIIHLLGSTETVEVSEKAKEISKDNFVEYIACSNETGVGTLKILLSSLFHLKRQKTLRLSPLGDNQMKLNNIIQNSALSSSRSLENFRYTILQYEEVLLDVNSKGILITNFMNVLQNYQNKEFYYLWVFIQKFKGLNFKIKDEDILDIKLMFEKICPKKEFSDLITLFFEGERMAKFQYFIFELINLEIMFHMIPCVDTYRVSQHVNPSQFYLNHMSIDNDKATQFEKAIVSEKNFEVIYRLYLLVLEPTNNKKKTSRSRHRSKSVEDSDLKKTDKQKFRRSNSTDINNFDSKNVVLKEKVESVPIDQQTQRKFSLKTDFSSISEQDDLPPLPSEKRPPLQQKEHYLKQMEPEQFKSLQIMQQHLFGRCDGIFNMNSHLDHLNSVIKTPIPSSPDKIFPRDNTWSLQPQKKNSKSVIEKNVKANNKKILNIGKLSPITKTLRKTTSSRRTENNYEKDKYSSLDSRYEKKKLIPRLITLDPTDVKLYVESTTILLSSHLQFMTYLSFCLNKEISFFFSNHVETHRPTLFRQDSVFTTYFSRFFFENSSKFFSNCLSSVVEEWSYILTEFTPHKINECITLLITSLKKNIQHFPDQVRLILSQLRVKLEEKKYPLKLQLIGSFVFLRFIIPPILQSEKYKVFDKEKVPISNKVRKNFISLGKIIQHTSNNILFDELDPLHFANDIVLTFRPLINSFLEEVSQLNFAKISKNDNQKKVETAKRIRKSENFKDHLNNVYTFVSQYQIAIKENLLKESPNVLKDFNIDNLSNIILS